MRELLKKLRPSQVWFIAGVLLSAAYVVLPTVHTGVFFSLLSLSAVVAIMIGVRWTRPELRLPWYLLAVGQLCFTLGDAIVYIYPQIVGSELPFPALSDVFYLAMYPFVIMAGVVLLERVPIERKVSTNWFVFLGTAIATTAAIITPFLLGGQVIPDLHILAAIYPILDFVFLLIIARAWLNPSPPTYYILLFGIISLFVVDAMYAVAININNDFDPTGTHLDVGWLIYYVCLGAAALTRNGERPFVPVTHRGIGFKEWITPGAWKDAYEGEPNEEA